MERRGLQSTIQVKDIEGKLYAFKYATQAGIDDLKEQLDLFEIMPLTLRKHYPEIIDFNLNTNPYYYSMPFYSYPSLRYLLLDTNVDESQLISKIDKILYFLVHNQHKWKVRPLPLHYLDKTYFSRAKNRLIKLASQDRIIEQVLKCKYLVFEGKSFLNPLHLIEKIENHKGILSLLQMNGVCSTHGQMEFAHMLISQDTDDFILLDPKGPENYLDPFYDFGKLRQCSHSYLDWIEEGFFDISEVQIHKDRAVVSTLDFKLPERLKVCENIHRSIIRLLLTYTNFESHYLFEQKSLFAEAIHLCSSVPFCYGYGEIKKGIACYCMATLALNEFFQTFLSN